MNATLRTFFREFLWDDRPKVATTSAAGDAALFESGSTLITRIEDAIRLRRSVLVTGPRGSGKSYCARKATENAVASGVIGGYHFLQGNREIPRDYLSEDMLVLRSHDNKPLPQMLDALAVRLPNKQDTDLADLRTSLHLKHFPGVEREAEREKWIDEYWMVLFLDEINRFGDGFLDSLLSLTEERTIVRGGVKLHVPIVVVATANPPGYDITAKKLSPPLQARISRSYRVSQPSLPSLVYRILPEPTAEYSQRYRRAFHIPMELRKRLVSASLCLWGKPSPERKGVGFLTPATQTLLLEVADRSAPLGKLLEDFGALVSFGPDARSVGDWLGCAMGLAKSRSFERVDAWVAQPSLDAGDVVAARKYVRAELTRVRDLEQNADRARAAEQAAAAAIKQAHAAQPPVAAALLQDLADNLAASTKAARTAEAKSAAAAASLEKIIQTYWQIPVTAEDLIECALEVLAHKVRENFNEGTDPAKVAEKERLISAIVRTALVDPELSIFEPPYEAAISRLTKIDRAIYADGVRSRSDRSTAEFVYELIDELALPQHAAFVLACMRGDPEKHTSCAQIDLLRRASRRARTLDLTEAAEALSTAAGGSGLGAKKLVEATQKAVPALAQQAWSRAIRAARITAQNSPTTITDWLLSLEILAAAADMAPVAAPSLSRISPMVSDVFRRRTAKKKQEVSAAMAEIIRDRRRHHFGDATPSADTVALIRKTVANLEAELTAEAASRVGAIAAVLLESLETGAPTSA